MHRLLDRSLWHIWQYLRRKALRRKRPGESNDDSLFVFALSTCHTGTQTPAALFGLARNVSAYHEPKPLVYGLSKLSHECNKNIRALDILQGAIGR